MHYNISPVTIISLPDAMISNVTLTNIENNLVLSCQKKDYRTTIVTDDLHTASFKNVKVTEPGKNKMIHTYKSTGITGTPARQ